MPKVPGRERQVQQVGLNTGRVQTQLPASAFGGGKEISQQFATLKNAVGTAFKGIEKIQKEAKIKGDTAKVFDARVKADQIFEAKRQVVNQTQGENALGLQEQLNPEIDKSIKEIEDSLANDEQKLAFKREVVGARSSFNRMMNDHGNREFKKVFTVKTESILKSNFKNAVENFADENAIKGSIKDSKDKYKFYAEMQGIPKEERDLKLAKIESDTHVGVLQRIADGGADLKAKEYYKKHKKNIDPVAYGKIEKALEETNLRGESQRRSDTIWLKSEKDIQAAITSAEKISDPKTRDETIRRLKVKESERQAFKKVNQEKSWEQATEFVKNNLDKDPKDVMPSSLWTSLTLGQQTSLSKYQATPKNNDKTWLKFLDMSAKEMSDLPLAEFEEKYWTSFDSAHRNRAESMWKNSKEAAKQGKAPVLTSPMSFSSQIHKSLQSAKIIRADKTRAKLGKKESERYVQFEQRAAEALEEFEVQELQGKRKATFKERQQVLDSILLDTVFIDKSFFGRGNDKVPTAMILEDERGDIYVPLKEVPDSWQKYIRNIAKSNGRTLSAGEVENSYALKLAGNQEAINKIAGVRPKKKIDTANRSGNSTLKLPTAEAKE